MSVIAKTYITIYLKRNAALTAIFSLPITLLLLIVALILGQNLWQCLFPLLAGVFLFCVSSLYVLRFLRLIKQQEELLCVSFSDEGRTRMGKILLFLSNEWLICAGSCAFHKSYVRSFSQEREPSYRGVSGYKITVKTIDGKCYSFRSPASVYIDKLRKWKKENSCDL